MEARRETGELGRDRERSEGCKGRAAAAVVEVHPFAAEHVVRRVGVGKAAACIGGIAACTGTGLQKVLLL